MKFHIEKLPNGNYLVQVYDNDKKIVERAYDELKGVVSLLLMTFESR